VRGRPALIVIGAFLAAAALGCGTAGRESDAAAVAERFAAAVAGRDGEAACAELSEETAGRLEQQEDAPCEEAVLRLDLPAGGKVAETGVWVRSASVRMVEGATTFLDEGAHGWRVTAAGCTPTARDQPYDCELEG
jgi:hypothetical protein